MTKKNNSKTAPPIKITESLLSDGHHYPDSLLDASREMILYLCGPMASKAQHNIPVFDAGTKRLRGLGFNVISPAEVDSAGDRILKMRGAHVTPGSKDWIRLLIEDLKLMVDVDALVVLPDWEKSGGAKLEVQTALALKKPVYSYDGLRRIPTAELHQVEFKAAVIRETENLVHSLNGNFQEYSKEQFGGTARLVSEMFGHEITPDQILLMLFAVCLTIGDNETSLDVAALETYSRAIKQKA